MAAASKIVEPEVPLEDGEPAEAAPAARFDSGIVVTRGDASPHTEDEDDSGDDGFETVTLEEIELLDASAPPRTGRRRSLRHRSTRAAERRDRSARGRRERAPTAPATESLARGMAALILLVAVAVVFSVAAQ